MGAGRKVIPINIKKAKGTFQACREKIVPKPSSKRPIPPSWLNKRAKQIFRHMDGRLAELGMSSASHTEVLALLACRQEELERFDKMLNDTVPDENGVVKGGYIYEAKNSFGDIILRDHPAVKLREKAARHVHSLLVEFGLTPSAAQKVGTKKETKKKNEFDEY
jgi:P27 family predicted phage terminase small subunit